MTEKKEWYPLYWSNIAKRPIVIEMVVPLWCEVRNGAGTKGKVIGGVGEVSGVRIVADEQEQDLGWIRIIAVKGCTPVPQAWIDKQEDAPEWEREWWIKKNNLIPAASDEAGEITLMLKRNKFGAWSVTEL